jgi:hypothetical protein
MKEIKTNNLQNLAPLPYRHVSVQPYHGPMTEPAIVKHLLGKDSYRRTRYVILEQDEQCAVAAVGRDSETPLFSDITSVQVLALPDTCVLAWDDAVDPGNPTSLANKAAALGLGPEATLVVHGMDGHVNFIHHPNPVKVRVIEVVPPNPPKLLRLAEKVLSYVGDLPPVQLVIEPIELETLAAQAPQAEAYLIPCRAAGLNFSAPTYFLDERPARRNWTMVACERSRQIHRHFYGDDAPRVEMCPRQLVQDTGELTLLKCCLLEDHIEADGSCVIVPWGATLAQVQEGLQSLVKIHEAQTGPQDYE